MSKWRATGRAAWDEDGHAEYGVTNGNQEVCKEDIDDLARVLNSAPALRIALDDLVECLTIWEAEGTLPEEWNKPLMRAVAALKLAEK